MKNNLEDEIRDRLENKNLPKHTVPAVKIYYKTEGNIIYPDESMLTWGPFYFHSETKAKEKMEDVLKDITAWCNEEDPSLNITPTNVIRCYGGTQIVFRIRAWKDEDTIQECKGIISVGTFMFEDDAETTEKEKSEEELEQALTGDDEFPEVYCDDGSFITPGLSNNRVQDILDEMGMIDENGYCPYTAEEIFRAGVEWKEQQIEKVTIKKK